MNITEKEKTILNFITSKNGEPIFWEELAQFANDPTTVNIKTVQKWISEMKRKGISIPNKFTSISKDQIKKDSEPKKEQKLVKVTFSDMGNQVKESEKAVHVDFKLCSLGNMDVITKSGRHKLNQPEWEMFKYFYNNSEKIISISELRDNVVFPKAGSKLPARWFDAIMRVINGLRRQVPELKPRLLTIKMEETAYIFK